MRRWGLLRFLWDSHLFRVERGKITYIHTLSTCAAPGCGLNGTLGELKRRDMEAVLKRGGSGEGAGCEEGERRVEVSMAGIQ